MHDVDQLRDQLLLFRAGAIRAANQPHVEFDEMRWHLGQLQQAPLPGAEVARQTARRSQPGGPPRTQYRQSASPRFRDFDHQTGCRHHRAQQGNGSVERLRNISFGGR